MHNDKKGVIFDVDGTLADSNDAHAHAFVEAFESLGYQVTFSKVRSLIGMGADRLIPEISGLAPFSPSTKHIEKLKADIFKRKYLPEIKAFPMARTLVLKIEDEGYKTIIASSAGTEELGAVLRQTNLIDLFSRRVSADGLPSKPAPDIIVSAIEQLKISSKHIFLLGDTPYDVQAARHAGIACVALRCGGWSDEELKDAIAIYDDPADLLSRFNSSPLWTQSNSNRAA